MTSSLSSATSSSSNSAVVKFSYQPRKKVPSWSQPFNWTVNGLRSVENLGTNWKNVECLELAKNAAKFVSAFTVSVLTLPTIVIPILLAREYSIQKQNEAYFSSRKKQHAACKQSFQKALAKSKKKEEKSTNQAKALKKDSQALKQQIKTQTDSKIPDTCAVLQTEIAVLKQSIENLRNEKTTADANGQFFYSQVQRYKEQIQNLLVRAGVCAEKEKTNTMQRLIAERFQENQSYNPNMTYEDEPTWTLTPVFRRLQQLEDAVLCHRVEVPAFPAI